SRSWHPPSVRRGSARRRTRTRRRSGERRSPRQQARRASTMKAQFGGRWQDGWYDSWTTLWDTRWKRSRRERDDDGVLVRAGAHVLKFERLNGASDRERLISPLGDCRR